MLRTLTKTSAWFTCLGIVALYAFSLYALVGQPGTQTLLSFAEIAQILQYSLLQAILSATLSVILGGLLARSFFYLEFKGKTLLYKLIAFVWALPSMVIIFAVIGVFGNSGWLANLFGLFGLSLPFNLYGLQGILIAHCLFNIPLVMKYYTNGLRLIPSSRYKLAAQLGLSGLPYWRIVELPIVRTLLPTTFMTVFLVCFTSFPIVLMLGGSPKYSTLEVAIYQAVAFEFDFAKAVWLIMVQLAVGVLLYLLMNLLSGSALKRLPQAGESVELWKPKPTGKQKRLLQAVVFSGNFTILLPLAAVVYKGLTVSGLGGRLLNPALWQAAGYSLLLSLITAVFAVAVSYILALETRRQLYRRQRFLYSLLSSITQFPLILPIYLLAVGLFILFLNHGFSALTLPAPQLLLLVGICNGLTLLPFVYPLLFTPMYNSFTAYDRLAQSLDLQGWRRWWIVERPYLRRPLANAFALAVSSGLGSFTVIAFFGSADFSSLPYLLYQQLGSYRSEEAAVTALVLMLFAWLPFLCIKDNR